MRSFLRNSVFNNQSAIGKANTIFLQIMILLAIVCFSLETIPNLTAKHRFILHLIDIALFIIFSIEYVLRIIEASNPFRYIFSFMGIIDLLAILPFILHAQFDLRALRALRLLQVFRLLRTRRYNMAIKRVQVAFKWAREEIIMFLAVMLILMYFAAVGIYYFEHHAQPEKFSSIFTSFWWAVCTLTTVGYGDAYPITVGGRAFTIMLLIIGLGFISIPAGIVSSALSKSKM
jgi:voltage-gated potassium channel